MATSRIPAIVIVAGSGPIDRNGNVPGLPGLRLFLNTSNRFADHMMAPGRVRDVAVLSYDKRGVGKSLKGGDRNLYHRAGMMDLVRDAVEAVRFLAAHPRIDTERIVLLGHSEGAIILPLICRECKADGSEGLVSIRGCIFYSGFGASVEEAMTAQREQVMDEVRREAGCKGWLLRKVLTEERIVRQYDDLMAKVNADDNPDFVSAQCGLVKHPAKWIREHMSYDARAALADHVTCHCLAVTGQKDVQVRDEHCLPGAASAMVPNAPSIEAHRPANLTHALRSLDGPSLILNVGRDYKRMGKIPLDPELLKITDEWCDRILV